METLWHIFYKDIFHFKYDYLEVFLIIKNCENICIISFNPINGYYDNQLENLEKRLFIRISYGKLYKLRPTIKKSNLFD